MARWAAYADYETTAGAEALSIAEVELIRLHLESRLGTATGGAHALSLRVTVEADSEDSARDASMQIVGGALAEAGVADRLHLIRPLLVAGA